MRTKTVVDDYYRQITERQPSRLATTMILLIYNEGFLQQIENTRRRIGQVGEDDARVIAELHREQVRFKARTGVDPMTPQECARLIRRLSAELRRQYNVHKKTDEYRRAQKRMQDFAD